MPKLVSGSRAPIAAISSLRILVSAALNPPPPYSVGQSGTVQPRDAMTSSHCFCAGDWNWKLRPPQQASFSLRIGVAHLGRAIRLQPGARFAPEFV